MADVSPTQSVTDSEMNDRIVGIDLGTSYSALAVLDEDGQPRVIDNSNQSPLTVASSGAHPVRAARRRRFMGTPETRSHARYI